MPSKNRWILQAKENDFTIRESIDLSFEASNFWIYWLKIARILIFLRPKFIWKKIKKRFPESFNNLIAICFLGYTLKLCTSEYGIIVFDKNNKQ